jgi:N-acetylglucosamine malate deacetylase 1
LRGDISLRVLRPTLILALACAAVGTAATAHGQAAPSAPAAPRVILAIGAHAGDMELSAGSMLARQRRLGDSVVFLHLTLGERGNRQLAPNAYGEQKRREAREAAAVIGAEIILGPWRDGEIPNDEAARRWVADVIRRVKPAYVVTHWRNSIHKDHSTTHALVKDAVLLASLDGIGRTPPHRGIRGVYYAENWEDSEDFTPYVFVDVSEDGETWREMVSKYEFVRGGVSAFRYLEYYNSLALVRGATVGRLRAVAFDIEQFGKRRVLDALP